MDSEPTTVHAHQRERTARSPHGFPVVLVVSFLALSACTAFAVVMTNGPDYQANAAPVPVPTVGGGTSLLAEGPDTTIEALEFEASMPDGPVVLGEPGRLVVTVTNPHLHPIVLDRVEVDVLPPGDSGCRPEWLRVDDYVRGEDGVVTVPAGRSTHLTLAYTLVDLPGINQDDCKGTEFPLTISGSGRPQA